MQTKMARKVSMADVARELNVSPATVSYVLNGREGNLVGERTRERVLQVAQQMGYRPNRAAQALAGKSSNIIELCVNGFAPAFYAQVIRAFHAQISQSSYQMHVINTSMAHETDWDSLGSSWPIDGLIIADAHFSPDAVPHLVQRGVPIVHTGVYVLPHLDHVRVDIATAITQATRYLAERGKRVGYVSMWAADREAEVVDPRYPAYSEVMREAGLHEEIIVTPDIPGVSLRESARATVRDYVAKRGCPDGFLCFNDERAIATLAALRDLGLKAPQDAMIIGCDGIEETEYHFPTLSTIQYPFDELASLTWELLKNRIEEPERPLQNATLVAPLIFRESSAR